MKEITRQAIQAFTYNRNFKKSNTEVKYSCRENYPSSWKCELFLFGNLIAYKDCHGFFISSAGWETVTTKERLNGFDNVHIYQKNFRWILNGQSWNGKWREIQ
tara:strand:+ start:14211 stop:14519 length:309 start_codon:yes stop_codon:yes gene_type:complete